MMFEQWGHLPADVGRLTLPQLKMLLGPAEKRKKRTLTLAEVRALGLR